jgi:oligopeptide transport system permease protein
MTDDLRTSIDDPQTLEEEVLDQPVDYPVATAPPTQGASAAAAAGVEVVGQASLWSDAWGELRRNPIFLVSTLLILVLAVMAVAPQLFTRADPRACGLGNALLRPSAEHWFGTDVQGCDYYARTIYGARVSMLVGIIVTSAVVVIAVVLGSLSGFYGGPTDALITRVTDIWFAIPTILGGIIVLSVFNQKGIWQVALVLIILSWPTLLRLMRSSVLSVKEMDYIQAARALGAHDLRIIRRHILPNALAPVIVYGTITVGIMIVAEAALSFLGVGLQLPEISWGLMISEAQGRVRNDAYLLFFPAAFLSVAVFSFILLGDALRDALDPKSR